MSLAIQIAFRFMKSNKGQTILIIIGISIGVAIQIFIGLLIQSLQSSLIDTTIGNSPHVSIKSTSEDGVIRDGDTILSELERMNLSLTALTSAADFGGFIRKGNSRANVVVRGLSFPSANAIYGIQEAIYEGTMPSGENEVLIGKELQKDLNIQLGERLQIFVLGGLIPQAREIRVSGFFDLKVSSLNRSWIVTNQSTAQALYGFGQGITSIDIQIQAVFEADAVAASVEEAVGREGLRIENWKDQNEQLLSGLNGQTISSLFIQVFVIISVCLGIASVLIVSVLQKSKQIGILKAMGLTDKQTSLVFLSQGFFLGIFGAIVGVGLGLFLSFSFVLFAKNPDGSAVVPFFINYGFIALSGVIAVSASTIAALLPARRSSKLSPVEVIRNG